MADPWTEFYRSVGIGAPLEAPVPQQPMSVEDIYRGIYPSAGELTSRPVSTVPINPTTGMPYRPTIGGGGIGGKGVMATEFARLTLPPQNQPNGSIVANKDAARLPSSPVGYGPDFGGTPATAAIETAAPRFKPFASAYAAPARIASANTGTSGPMKLAFEPMSDTSGQNMADSAGRTIVTPSGKTYSPRQGNGNARTLPQVAPSDMRAPGAARPGLFASLFGGGQGGGIAGLFAPQAPSAPIALTPQQASNQNPAALAALNAGQTSYTNSSTNALMPTVSMSGKPRNTYGD